MKTAKASRILIVDDDRLLVATMRDHLAAEGFDVCTAETGEEALSQLAHPPPPNLIILDIRIRGMDGVGFLKKITRPDGHPRHPVLIFTAGHDLRPSLEARSIEGYIEKPCDLNELTDQVRQVLARKRRGTGGARQPNPLVLIGEDDPFMADALKTAFRSENYRIAHGRSGPEILEHAASRHPDAVLLKRMIAPSDGHTVVSLLRSMSRTRDIPIVLYDATESPPPKGIGNHLYLKTENPLELLGAVQQVLQSSRGAPGG